MTLFAFSLVLGSCRNVTPSKPALPFSIWMRSLGGATMRTGPWIVGAPIAEPLEGRAFVQPDVDAPLSEIVAAVSGAQVRGLSLNGQGSVNDATVRELGALRGQLTFLRAIEPLQKLERLELDMTAVTEAGLSTMGT